MRGNAVLCIPSFFGFRERRIVTAARGIGASNYNFVQGSENLVHLFMTIMQEGTIVHKIVIDDIIESKAEQSLVCSAFDGDGLLSKQKMCGTIFVVVFSLSTKRSDTYEISDF